MGLMRKLLQNCHRSMCVLTATQVLIACAPTYNARVSRAIASTDKWVQEEHDRYSYSNVMKTMDAHVLDELHKATPATLRTPVLAAAGANHGRLWVFWLCANPIGDGVEIRSIKTEDSFSASMPFVYFEENRSESQGGSLRMRMVLLPSDEPAQLKSVFEHPASYELALRANGKIVTKWVPILEN